MLTCHWCDWAWKNLFSLIRVDMYWCTCITHLRIYLWICCFAVELSYIDSASWGKELKCEWKASTMSYPQSFSCIGVQKSTLMSCLYLSPVLTNLLLRILFLFSCFLIRMNAITSVTECAAREMHNCTVPLWHEILKDSICNTHYAVRCHTLRPLYICESTPNSPTCLLCITFLFASVEAIKISVQLQNCLIIKTHC